MIKVAVFTDTFNEINGVATIYQNLSKIDNHAICFHIYYGEDSDIKTVNKLDLYYCKEMFFYKDIKFYIPTNKNLKIYDFSKYDIIHMATPSFVGLFGKKVAKLYHKPLVGFYHTDMVKYFSMYTPNYYIPSRVGTYLGYLLIKYFYSNCGIIICQSQEMKNHLLYDINLKNVNLWSTGVNHRIFFPPSNSEKKMLRKKWKLPEDSFICLYVGRISIEKNLDILGNLSESENKVSLVLAGRGPYLNMLSRKIDFIYLGEHKHDKLGEIYRLADCFVFPSKTDTFGNVILEALSSGLPIICDEKYVNSQVIMEEEIGLLYDNYQSLIDSIVKLKNNAMLYNQIRERAIFYSSNFSWEKSLIELKNIYLKILDKN